MEPIDGRRKSFTAWVQWFIIAMLIFLILIMWLKEACRVEKVEPQAVLAPDVATQHYVNGWVDVEEKGE